MRDAGDVDRSEASVPPEAVVGAAWVAVRAEPGHRSELVSQWLCGERLVVLGREQGWLRTRGPDGYEGWCSGGGLLLCDKAVARRWEEAASARSTGSRLERPWAGRDDHAGRRGEARWLPFGARVVREAADVVRLPLQVRVADPGDGTVVGASEREQAFPPQGREVARTASLWSGAPYLWGGRTPRGTDCSGFVQAVYGMHGVALPRDSGRQMEVTADVATGVGDPRERRAGDLLFFRSDEGGAVSHVALSLGGTRIVHAADARGGFARDDLANPPPELEGLGQRLVAVTRPLVAPGRQGRDRESIEG